MSIKTAKGKDALFTEINITPLTDIFLVLLIIMMVVAPTFQSNDKAIAIPEINSGVAVEQRNATVSVTKEGIMFINGKQITPDKLTDELLVIKESLDKKEVVVRADEKVKSSEIMSIMNSAKEAEYTKLTLAGEPLTKKEQHKLNSKKNNENNLIETNNESNNWVD